MKAFATHRKARFDYEVLDTFEAGIMLSGQEVKSIRNGKAKLEGAYIIIRGNEVFITGMHITPYQVANTPKDYEPEQIRKLLLSKKEISILDQKTNTDRLTVIPLKLYNHNQKIKVEIAVVRGKKKQDKRNTLKDRDNKREIDRTLKTQY